jgi:hypothetical protein
MHKNATKCNETLNKWCKNKHGASEIMDMLETYQDPQGKKANSVEETSFLSAIMAMLVNDRAHVDPNNVPLASLVAQEEHIYANFIKNNNFNNNAFRNNFASNIYRPYSSTNGNGNGNYYGNSSNNNRGAPSDLEVMLKDFISK